MIVRARLALIFAYSFLSLAGAVSLIAPVASVQAVLANRPTLHVYGTFLLLGGLTSLFAVLMRGPRSASAGWWFIEIAGLCLLATAVATYSAVLFDFAYENRSIQVTAAALIVAGFASSLVGRAYEAFKIRKFALSILDEVETRERDRPR